MKSGIINLEDILEFYRNDFPRETRNASAMTLTRAAFLGRKSVQEVIGSEMEVHSRSFVRVSTKYEGARFGDSMDRQVSRFGTTSTDRSTGWVEQPRSGADKRKRKWGKGARRGGKSAVPQKYRFKRSKEVLSLEKAGGWNKLMKLVEDREHFDDSVLIGDNDKGVYPGVFKFMRRRVSVKGKDGRTRKLRKMVRLASDEPRTVKRVDIIGLAYKKMMRREDPIKNFEKNLQKQLVQTIKRRFG